MKYVVAEIWLLTAQKPARVVMTDHEWAQRTHSGYVKMFETDTVTEAEALVALLPEINTLTGVNT